MKQHDVIISGHHLELTEALKTTVLQKVQKLFAHEERIIRIRVDLCFNPRANSHANEFAAKGHIEIRGSDIIITEESDDLYKSIDQLIDKLDRGLRRRSRLHRVKRRDTHRVEIPASIPKAIA